MSSNQRAVPVKGDEFNHFLKDIIFLEIFARVGGLDKHDKNGGE